MLLLLLSLFLGICLACSDGGASQSSKSWILGVRGNNDDNEIDEIIKLILGEEGVVDFKWKAKGLLLCQFKRSQDSLDPLLRYIANHDEHDDITQHEMDLLSKVSWLHENVEMDSCGFASELRGVPDAEREVHTTATLSWGLDRLDQMVKK